MPITPPQKTTNPTKSALWLLGRESTKRQHWMKQEETNIAHPFEVACPGQRESGYFQRWLTWLCWSFALSSCEVVGRRELIQYGTGWDVPSSAVKPTGSCKALRAGGSQLALRLPAVPCLPTKSPPERAAWESCCWEQLRSLNQLRGMGRALSSSYL